MERVVDDHTFTLPNNGSQSPSCCRLQVFVGDGHRPVVMATQHAGEPGQSLTNAAEKFAEAAWERHLPEDSDPPVWIQHYTSGPDRWLEVLFEVDDGKQLRRPRWIGTTQAKVESRLGGPIDASRGGRYVVAPVAEPPPRCFRFEPVTQLPPTSPFRVDGCMAGTGTSWQRMWRRGVLRRARRCCWYHGGSWARVLQLLERLVAAGQLDDLSEDDVGRLVGLVAEET